MTKTKIMIVEDESLVSASLKMSLQNMGHEVCAQLRYGENVLESALRERPDLILMDIKLKGEMDGVDAALNLKKNLNAPVIFLTAFSDDATLERAKAVQPHGYLTKPVRSEELKSTVEMALFKFEMEKRLKESEERYRIVADFAYDWETWVSPEDKCLYCSPSCQRITGHRPSFFAKDYLNIVKITHPADQQRVTAHFKAHHLDMQKVAHLEFRIITPDGEERWLEHVCQAVYTLEGKYLGRRASNRDITTKKQAELEKEALIEKLQQALEKVKQLSGMLPICANCKKIRDDKGYWKQIEEYIRDHSEADFSHSICPECAKKLYPDIELKD